MKYDHGTDRPFQPFCRALLPAAIVLSLMVGGAADAVVPGAGEVLLVARGDDTYLPGIYAISMAFGQVNLVANPMDFVNLTAVSWGHNKLLYVADEGRQGITGDGRIYVVDSNLLPGATPEAIDYPHFSEVADLIVDGAGGFYVLDRKADPLGEGYSGAVFHLDPGTAEIVPIASSPYFNAPENMVLEESGTLLVFDPTGLLHPSDPRPGPGAIYRVDPLTKSITLAAELDFTVQAAGMAVLDNETLLIADANYDAGHYPLGGAVLKVSPSDFSVQGVLAIGEFRDPTDLAVSHSGTIIVLDRTANPEGQQHPGTLFEIDADTGELLFTVQDFRFRSPTAIAVMGGADIRGSSLGFVDLDHPPIRRGHRLRYTLALSNSGIDATEEILLDIDMGVLACLPGTARITRGSYGFDAVQNKLLWTIDMPGQARDSLVVDTRVPYSVQNGDPLVVQVEAIGERVTYSRTTTGVVLVATQTADIAFVDPDAQQVFTAEAGSGVETILCNPGIMPNPVDVAYGFDGLIYALDGTIGDGKIVRIDPETPDLAEVVYEGSLFYRAAGMCLGHDGALLIVDAKRFEWGPIAGEPGVVYRFDPATMTEPDTFHVDPDTLNPIMQEPVAICADVGGGYLVTDFVADFAEDDGGAVFEIDGTGQRISARRLTSLIDPVCTAVGPDSCIYALDAKLGSPDEAAIWFLGRPEGPGSPAWVPRRLYPYLMGDPSLIKEPYGIQYTASGLIICDRTANPAYPGQGAIFRYTNLGDDEWELTFYSVDEALVSPQRMAIFEPPVPEILSFEIEDLSGGSLYAGDTLTVSVRFQNNSTMPGLGIAFMLQYSTALHSVAAATTSGDVYDNDAHGSLHWSGDLLRFLPVDLSASFVVDSLVTGSGWAEVTASFQGFTGQAPITRALPVAAPLTGGEILVVDAEADAFETGVQRGTVFSLDRDNDRLVAYRTDSLFVDPVDLVAVNAQRFLVLDAGGDGEYGVVLDLRMDTDSTAVFGPDDVLDSPQRMLTHPEGGWIIMDPAAQVGVGNERGVLYRLTAAGELRLFLYSTDFRALADMTFDTQGRLWLSDTEADPGNLGGNTGTIFLIEPDSVGGDYEITETFTSTYFRDPHGLAWMPRRGLLFTDPGWEDDEGRTGVRLLNPATGLPSEFAASNRLVHPTRISRMSDEEALVIDPQAAPPPPLPWGGEGVVFSLDLVAEEFTPLASHSAASALSGIARIPAPETLISFFGAAEDSSGRWASRGDTLHCRIDVANPSESTEPQVQLEVALSEHLLLDVLSAEAPRGDLLASAGGLSWVGPLGANDTVSITYAVELLSTPGLSSWADQTATLDPLLGTRTTATLTYYVSSAVGAGELLILDSRANPRGLPSPTGTLYRVEGPMREMVPILADSMITSPFDMARLPGSRTEFLIADADADIGPGDSDGALLRVSIHNGGVAPAFTDSTLINPLAVAVHDSVTCYLLDVGADPYGLDPTGLHPPGAIYRIDLTSGSGTVVYSDTTLTLPYDIVVDPDPEGLVYILDRAHPAEDPYGGAVFELNPADGSLREVYAGNPLRSPRCMTWMPTGRILLADTGDIGSQLGVLYSIGTDGDLVEVTRCREMVDPLNIALDETGAAFVIDRGASPIEWPTSLGAVFHFDTVLVAGGPDCNIFMSGPPFARPCAADVYYEGTPILLNHFALSETGNGVCISWSPPEDLAGADYYVYRREPERPGSTYDLITPAPVQGSGAELVFVDYYVTAGTLYEYSLVATLPNGSHLEFGPLSIRVSRGPGRFALERILPIPFPMVRTAEGMTIRFATPAAGEPVSLGIFDVTGRLLRRLIDEPLAPGQHAVLWNGRDSAGAPVGSGVYFVRLEAGVRCQNRRVVLVR